MFASKTSWRRLQDMSSRRLQDMSSRRLQDVLEDEKLLHWRRIEDVFNTYLEDVLKTNKICWAVAQVIAFWFCNSIPGILQYTWYTIVCLVSLVFLKLFYKINSGKMAHIYKTNCTFYICFFMESIPEKIKSLLH